MTIYIVLDLFVSSHVPIYISVDVQILHVTLIFDYILINDFYVDVIYADFAKTFSIVCMVHSVTFSRIINTLFFKYFINNTYFIPQ